MPNIVYLAFAALRRRNRSSIIRRGTPAWAEPLESRRLLAFGVSFPNGATISQRTDINVSPHVPPNLPGNGGNEAETLVVVNPTDPQNVVVFDVDFNTTGALVPMKSWYSFDGGISYGPSDIEYPSGHTPQMDPVAAFDRAGNLYFAHLTQTLNPTMFHVSVAKSTDGGQTWGQPRIVDSAPPNPGIDKPWITVGPNPANMSQDIVYVAYLGPGGLHCKRSLNGGDTFQNDVILNDAGNGAHFPHLVAQRSNGRLFAVWHDTINNDIKLDYSDDGGVTWQNPPPAERADRFVGTTPINAWFPFNPAPARRFFAVPSVAVAETGTHPGRIFVSYTTSPSEP